MWLFLATTYVTKTKQGQKPEQESQKADENTEDEMLA